VSFDLTAQQRGEGRTDRPIEVADNQFRLGRSKPMSFASYQSFANPWILHSRRFPWKVCFEVVVRPL
jgi:hypothetical protein